MKQLLDNDRARLNYTGGVINDLQTTADPAGGAVVPLFDFNNSF